MKKTEITLTSNILSTSINLEDEEMYFIDRFSWQNLDIEGKGKELSEEVQQAVALMHYPDRVEIELRVPAKSEISKAYDQMLTLQNDIQIKIINALRKFKDAAPSLQSNLDMTMAAMGLVDFPEKGEK